MQVKHVHQTCMHVGKLYVLLDSIPNILPGTTTMQCIIQIPRGGQQTHNLSTLVYTALEISLAQRPAH